jgi:hypothetical protein
VDSVLDDVILRLRKHFSRDSKNGKGIEEVKSTSEPAPFCSVLRSD